MYTYVRRMSVPIKISSLLVLHGPPQCPPWMPSVDRWVHRRPARATAVPPRRHHLAVRTASAVAPSASEPPRTSRLRRAPDLRPVLYPRPRGRPPPAVGALLPHPILSIRTDGWWMNPKNSAFPATVVDASAWGWPPSPPAGRRRVGPPRGSWSALAPPSHRTARPARRRRASRSAPAPAQRCAHPRWAGVGRGCARARRAPRVSPLLHPRAARRAVVTPALPTPTLAGPCVGACRSGCVVARPGRRGAAATGTADARRRRRRIPPPPRPADAAPLARAVSRVSRPCSASGRCWPSVGDGPPPAGSPPPR